MKNPIFKKFIALAVAATMVVSSQIGTSAEGISDVYDEVTESVSTGTGTDTTTSSGTSTGAAKLDEGRNGVLGINFDKTSVVLEKNGSKDVSAVIQARLAFENADIETITLANGKEVDRTAVSGFIKFEIVDKKPIYSTETPITGNRVKNAEGKYEGKFKINAKTAGTATVKASIDVDQDGEDDFETYCYVTVKEYASAVSLSTTNLYKGHSYNLNKYATLTLGGKQIPATTSGVEKVTFSTSTEDAKYVTISDAGVLTVKKVPASGKVSIQAVTETGKKLATAAEFTVKEGVIATDVKITKLEGATVSSAKGSGLDTAKASATLDPTDAKNDYKYIVGATASSTKSSEPVTDEIVYTSSDKKQAVISVIDNGDGTATIEANGVGKAKITATAYPSKKKATIDVEVTATKPEIVISASSVVYTGQKSAVTATVTTGKKQITVKDTVKFELSSKTNASVSGKTASVSGSTVATGTISAKNIIKNYSTSNIKEDVKLTARLAKNGASKTVDVTIKQSNVSKIDVINVTALNDKTTTGNNAYLVTGANKNTKATDKYKLAVRTNNKPYVYTTNAYDEKGNLDKDLAASIDWSISGKQASLSVDGAEANVTALKAGKPSLKVSFITLTNKNGKYSAKKYTVTVKLEVEQHTTQLVLKKSEQVANNVANGVLKKDTTVTFAVSQQLPKGTKDTISWQVITGYNGGVATDKVARPLKGTTGKSFKIVIPAGTPVGTVVKVGAYTNSGAATYGYVYVTEKTTAVQVLNGLKKDSLSVGQSKILKPQVKVNGAFVDAAKDATLIGETSWSYTTEPVTYTVDKKGASVVKVDAEGNVTALKPGKATVTIKAVSGKSAKITFTVQ